MARRVDHQAAPWKPRRILDVAMRKAVVLAMAAHQLGQCRERAQYAPLHGGLDGYAAGRDFHSIALVVAERRILRGGSGDDVEPHGIPTRSECARFPHDGCQPPLEPRHRRRQSRGSGTMRFQTTHRRVPAAAAHFPWQGHQVHGCATRLKLRYRLRQSPPNDASRPATSTRRAAIASSPSAFSSASAYTGIAAHSSTVSPVIST